MLDVDERRRGAGRTRSPAPKDSLVAGADGGATLEVVDPGVPRESRRKLGLANGEGDAGLPFERRELTSILGLFAGEFKDEELIWARGVASADIGTESKGFSPSNGDLLEDWLFFVFNPGKTRESGVLGGFLRNELPSVAVSSREGMTNSLG